jgi:hypothetical protein
MDVKRMNLARLVHDTPMMVAACADTRHRRVGRTVSLAVDIEALLILGEGYRKVRRTLFECPLCRIGQRRDNGLSRGGVRRIAGLRHWPETHQIGQRHGWIWISVGSRIETPAPQP